MSREVSGDLPAVDVYFALPSGSLVLDWAGPAEALRIANLDLCDRGLRRDDVFRLHFVAPKATSIGSVGVELARLDPLPAHVPEPSWIVVVGRSGTVRSRAIQGLRSTEDSEDEAVVQWLRRLQPGRAGLRLVTVCSGALLAASAGLLRGRRATTHHLDIELLASMDPSACVERDRVFVRDEEVWSSAGVTTGIDLALHLIAEHAGPLTAARVAQRMAVAMRRGPDDPQLSPFLAHRQHFSARLHRVQDAVSQSPRDPWDAPRMAALVHATPRTLHRLFTVHAGITPQAYVRAIRLALARTALESGSSVTQAAALAGFHSDVQLRRAWLATGMPATPRATRARGRAASRSDAPASAQALRGASPP